MTAVQEPSSIGQTGEGGIVSYGDASLKAPRLRMEVCHPWIRVAALKPNINLKARKHALHLNYIHVLDRYVKDATNAWRMDANCVAFGDMEES